MAALKGVKKDLRFGLEAYFWEFRKKTVAQIFL